MAKGLNIAIAGCGPAGLAAALLLNAQGHRAVLYDQFAKPSPLGSGLMLQPTGLAVLKALGLDRGIVKAGAPIYRLQGRNAIGDTALDARYADLAQPDVFGIGIHRSSLFGILFQAVEDAGIAVQTSKIVAGSVEESGGRRLGFDDGSVSEAYDLVVDASGVNTRLTGPQFRWLAFGALWATLKWDDRADFCGDILEQRYRGAREMVGVLPTGRRSGKGPWELAFFWSLHGDEYPAWKKAGLEAWKAQVCDLWPQCAPLLDQITSPQQLTFARYAHRELNSPIASRLVHIGDAWHSASPQLGQGANMALLDAFGLSRALEFEGTLDKKLRYFVKLRKDHVRRYQRLTAIFTPLYQSNTAAPAILRDAVLAPLSRVAPGPRVQANLVSGLSGNPLGKLELAMPDYSALSPASASSSNPRASGEDQS